MADVSEQVVSELQQLSDVVLKARETPVPAGANDILREVIKSCDPVLAPLGRLWAGDSLAMEMRFAEAIEEYEALRGQGSQEKGVPLAVTAALGAAACHRALGQSEQACKRLAEAAEAYSGSEAVGGLMFEGGQIAEDAGEDDRAREYYERAAKAPVAPGEDVPVAEFASRAIKRLANKEPKHVFQTVEALAMRLAMLLADRSADQLVALASPTHFTLGFAGSERHFIDFGSIAEEFRADLAQSQLNSDPIGLSGSGDKRYMASQYWRGRTFVGRVYFILTRYKGGWEWSGMACTALPKELVEKFGHYEKATNQPLTIAIRAPWPAGRSFRAGGLAAWIVQQALIGAPFGLGFLIILALSANPAGWGPNGFYYNTSPTHRGADAFAIDFTAYVPGAPYADAAGGTPVLAAAQGLVTMVRSFIPSGGTLNDNRVVIDHGTTADETRRSLSQLIAGVPTTGCRYKSSSLHLAGPGLVRVSPGMMVRQGTRLGLMDDTGLSALNHLHFAMNDRDSSSGSFASVRPTPMSGQTLNDGEDGKVILSNNVMI